jgi:hypothetical protein
MTYGRLFPEGFPHLWAPNPDFTLCFPDYNNVCDPITRLTIFFAFIPRPGTRVYTAGLLLGLNGHELPHFEAIPWSLLRQLPKNVLIGYAHP